MSLANQENVDNASVKKELKESAAQIQKQLDLISLLTHELCISMGEADVISHKLGITLVIPSNIHASFFSQKPTLVNIEDLGLLTHAKNYIHWLNLISK